MSLCQPTVVGPLSELSQSVRVQGQLRGANVTVIAGGRTVAQGNASSGDQRFSLLPGAYLIAGDLVVAVQELAGESSELPTGDLGTGVQRKPLNAGQIGGVGLESHLWQCGQYVYVSGAIPGAEVQMRDTRALGSGIANEGIARFELVAPLEAGVAASVHQTVPGVGDGPDVTRVPDPIPAELHGVLPPPIMAAPLRGCDPSVRVSGVFDGTQVTIRDAAGVETTAGFDLSALTFVLPQPLTDGERLVIRQQFQRECKQTKGVWSAAMPVGPASPVDPPAVQGPLCAGATRATITNLRPGATVHISANGTVYDGTVPPDATANTFSVPVLRSSSVSATQEICGVLSGPSAVVPVDPREEHVPPALVLGPLFECARTVSVAKVHPGATIQIWSRNASGESPISDLVTFQTTQGAVDVCPYLMLGDDVFAVQWACSDAGVKSPTPERVKARPPLPPPIVLDPIFVGDSQVEVDSALPGALVELYATFGGASAVYVGHGVANNLSPITTIPLNAPARVKQMIFARQFLCNAQSENGRPVAVTWAPEFGPRPFYVMAHNPNWIGDVRDALAVGANCVEPDVNVYDGTTDQLCISEAGITGNTGGDSGAPALVDFLQDLRQAAIDFPQLALVIFDTKSPAVSAANGLTLLSAIREHLTADTDLNVIISVASLSETAMFDSIKNRLRPREGLMVDSENDPIAVSNFFLGTGVANECYANGITRESILGPNVRPSMERVCEFRAALGRTKFIYVWTVNDDDHMREYIRIGVDGVDTDDVSKLRGIIGEPEFGSVIRLATRQDDPFRPGDFTYGLVIHTSDKWMAGTDANITFTLTGTNGTASKIVNAKLPYRMERNDWNYVTVPSDDLGTLQSITVQRDNQGNAPDWHLDSITVQSVRYGVNLHAHFDCWIDSTAPFTQALTP